MDRAKQLKKLAKVLAKADCCTTRKEAQKLLKKAIKIDQKLSDNGTN